MGGDAGPLLPLLLLLSALRASTGLCRGNGGPASRPIFAQSQQFPQNLSSLAKKGNLSAKKNLAANNGYRHQFPNLPGVVGGTRRSPPGPTGGAEGGVRRESSNGARNGNPRAWRAPGRAADDPRQI